MLNNSSQLSALHLAYQEAVDRKDYLLCDKLRLEIRRVTTGQKYQIKIEDDLKLL